MLDTNGSCKDTGLGNRMLIPFLVVAVCLPLLFWKVLVRSVPYILLGTRCNRCLKLLLQRRIIMANGKVESVHDLDEKLVTQDTLRRDLHERRQAAQAQAEADTKDRATPFELKKRMQTHNSRA